MTAYLAILNNLNIEVASRTIMLDWPVETTTGDGTISIERPKAELDHAMMTMPTTLLIATLAMAASLLF